MQWTTLALLLVALAFAENAVSAAPVVCPASLQESLQRALKECDAEAARMDSKALRSSVTISVSLLQDGSRLGPLASLFLPQELSRQARQANLTLSALESYYEPARYPIYRKMSMRKDDSDEDSDSDSDEDDNRDDRSVDEDEAVTANLLKKDAGHVTISVRRRAADEDPDPGVTVYLLKKATDEDSEPIATDRLNRVDRASDEKFDGDANPGVTAYLLRKAPESAWDGRELRWAELQKRGSEEEFGSALQQKIGEVLGCAIQKLVKEQPILQKALSACSGIENSTDSGVFQDEDEDEGEFEKCVRRNLKTACPNLYLSSF